MIRIVMILFSVTLFGLALYSAKKKKSISHSFNTSQTVENQKELEAIFKKFSFVIFLLSIVGLLCAYLNNKLIALVYVIVVLLASTYFSMSLSKKM